MSSPWHYFFNDLPLSLAKPYVDACEQTYYVGPMSLHSENWRKARITAIVCTKDNAMPLKRQEGMWGWLEEEEELEGGDTDGDGFWDGYGDGSLYAAQRSGPKGGEQRRVLERIQACHSPWVSRAKELAGLIGKGWIKDDIGTIGVEKMSVKG
jgi:hypothetical protein